VTSVEWVYQGKQATVALLGWGGELESLFGLLGGCKAGGGKVVALGKKKKNDAEWCVKSSQLRYVRGWVAEWGPHDLRLF